jgi:hypothetical protein
MQEFKIIALQLEEAYEWGQVSFDEIAADIEGK